AERFGAAIAEPEAILGVECDVLAPCALGGVITLNNLAKLRTQIIAGAANNPLSRPGVGARLKELGILYAPDFIINAGGLVNVAAELDPRGYDRDRVLEKIARIPDTLGRIFSESDSSGEATDAVAIRLAEQ